MAKKKEPKPKPTPLPIKTPLNEEVMKGVWVDAIGFYVGKDYIILDGEITKPRSEKNYVVSRMMFPARTLESLVGVLTEALKKQKEFEKQEKTKTPKQ